MDSLAQSISLELNRRLSLRDPCVNETLGSVRLSILKDVSEILDLPFSYCGEKTGTCHCILVYPSHRKIIEKLWNCILRKCDYRITHSDRDARERFEHHGKSHVPKADLVRFVGVLVTHDTIPGKILKSRDINALLAVDGFQGYQSTDFKHYIGNLGVLDDDHVRAVRLMYGAFDRYPETSSLTGTDAACFIFLTLTQLYIKECELDHRTLLITKNAQRLAKIVLQKNSHYYKDVRHAFESDFIEKLADLYKGEVESKQDAAATRLSVLVRATANFKN